MAHFNQLTDAQTERLDMLAEECAEVIQIISKIKRHGYDSCHPDNTAEDNRDLLEKELGDVLGVLGHMYEHNDVQKEAVNAAAVRKMARARKYMHHYEEAESYSERVRSWHNDAIWAAFYRDKKTLGEIAGDFGLSSLYVLSPWLTKPVADAVLDMVNDPERASRVIDDHKDKVHPNGNPMYAADGTLLDENGNRSIFDDVDR